MGDDEIERIKSDLRARALSARAALPQAVREEAALAACAHFFETFILEPGEVVAAYWPLREEMDCQPILLRLMEAGQPVCLPVVTDPEGPLDMRLWEPGAALYPAGFGTLAPEALAPRAEPSLVIVPLLGFDASGTRLGYGGGHYDRTLAALPARPRIVGLGFAAQQLAQVPRAPHDIPLDSVVTETGVIHFGAGAE